MPASRIRYTHGRAVEAVHCSPGLSLLAGKLKQYTSPGCRKA
jgi:hypothetical protein